MKRRSFLGFLSLFPFAPSQAKKILDQASLKDPAKDQFACEALGHTWNNNVCMDEYGGIMLPEEFDPTNYTQTTTTTHPLKPAIDNCYAEGYEWDYNYEECMTPFNCNVRKSFYWDEDKHKCVCGWGWDKENLTWIIEG